MAHRVPVVSTNVGGLSEVVVDGEGGYGVDHHDTDGYASRLVMLLKDKDLRATQGLLGRRRYEAHFTASTMARQYSELVRRAVHGA
jgi:glycosyltransferase involved in cell wall biosynthesis